MKKHLLLGTALLVAISAFPQNNKQSIPTGVVKQQFRKNIIAEKEVQNTLPTTVSPINKIKPFSKSNLNAKVAAITVTRLSGSINAFGVLTDESNSLCYSPGPNIVSFIHRKSSTYTPAANGNSGTMVAMLSTNIGTTWDSTCLWTSAASFARYPQGGIYNPIGNTTYTNATVVGMGPFHNGGPWAGNWYASKKITLPGTNASGTDCQAIDNAALPPGVNVHHLSSNAFSSIDGGYVRSMSLICNDDAGATNVAFGPRGAMMTKGLYTAGSFSWTTDSFAPPTTLRTDGSKQININAPLTAWNEAGTIGYVVMYGSRLGAPTAQKGYQPIVYKTTNSGASWVLLPNNDFTTPAFKGLKDRIKGINTNSNVVIPMFTTLEGYDAAVDVNGNLHIVTTVLGTSSADVDSLDYNYQFTVGGEIYNYDFAKYYGKPTIYDFYTLSGGGWNYFIVDTMGSVGPSGNAGQPGVAANPWAAAAQLSIDARIQISRTADGKKIYYSWTSTDPAVAGNNWNIFPNIRVKGFDVLTDKVTPTYSVTDGSVTTPLGLYGVDGSAFFHYMCDKAVGSGTACVDMLFTSTNNAAADGNVDVDHYFIKGQSICATAFTLTPWRPLGVTEVANSETSTEVNIYPNPASEAATISVGLKDVKDFEISLYNSIGQQVITTMKINGKPGVNDVFVDLSKLNSGLYFYSVKTDNSVVTKKLIIE